MIPYLDAIDLSGVRDLAARSVLAEHVIPSLLGGLHKEGVDVLVSNDLRDKTAYNEEHRLDPLLTRLPFVDPDAQPNAKPEDTICMFLRADAALVGSICMRHFWIETSFGGEMSDLSLLYDNPKEMAEPAEVVIVKAKDAYRDVRQAWIALMAGGHVEQSFRKSECGVDYYGALLRLARIMAIAHWRWSWLVALIEPDVSHKIGFKSYGHEKAVPSVHHICGPIQHEYHLFISDREHMREILYRPEVGDVSKGLLALTDGEIETALKKRSGAC